MVLRCLFQARELIAQRWLVPDPPTNIEWVKIAKNTVTSENFVYKKRRFRKFEKIWGPWVDTLGLTSNERVVNRAFASFWCVNVEIKNKCTICLYLGKMA